MDSFSRFGFLNALTGIFTSSKHSEENQYAGAAINSPGNLPSEPLKADITPFHGKLDTAQLLHLIRRTLFGVTIADYNFFLGKTLDECLDILLTQAASPAPPVNVYNDDTFTDPDVPFGQTWVYAPFGKPDGDQDDRRCIGLKAWWVGTMINQDRSLTEKMTIFWSTFLAGQMNQMKDARLDYGYLALLRSFSLGNFKTLVRQITVNPGMLQYLNGNVSTALAPNENYSRELQGFLPRSV